MKHKSFPFGPKKGQYAPAESYWVAAPREGWQTYIEREHLKRMLASHYGQFTNNDAKRVVGFEE